TTGDRLEGAPRHCAFGQHDYRPTACRGSASQPPGSGGASGSLGRCGARERASHCGNGCRSDQRRRPHALGASAGYWPRLSALSQPREEWTLDTRRLGRRVLVFDRLDSTNNLAANLADDPSNDGLAILADEQTAGRGQHGRTWLAASGQSVLLSVILSPPAQL